MARLINIRIPAVAVLCVLALTGCVATKYQMAQKGAPPPTLLSITDSQPPIDVGVRSVIVDGGPGSWKRRALWDEYVVTIRNQGEEPLTIVDATLIDFSGKPLSPGVDPWALEKASQSLEQRYRSAGVAFARSAAPRAVVFGATAAGAAVGGAAETATAAAAGISVIALPVAYVVVWHKNRLNKAAISTEFARRRLSFPLTLAAGEMHTGSIFFPMVPDPRSLTLSWTSDPKSGAIDISLDSLVGMHVPAQRCVGAGKAGYAPCAAREDKSPHAKDDDSPGK
ncbi:MAG: hypothetical protein ACHQIL_10770 [Steroidobacterales bacterium]